MVLGNKVMELGKSKYELVIVDVSNCVRNSMRIVEKLDNEIISNRWRTINYTIDREGYINIGKTKHYLSSFNYAFASVSAIA